MTLLPLGYPYHVTTFHLVFTHPYSHYLNPYINYFNPYMVLVSTKRSIYGSKQVSRQGNANSLKLSCIWFCSIQG